MATLETIRTVQVFNGQETRTLAVLKDARGFWLHDTQNDPNADSLEQIADESDSAIMDANGFEIVAALTACEFEIIPGRPQEVILTEGCFVGGKQIAGVFACEDDARAWDADERALAKVAFDSLTPAQKAIAAANSEAI